MPDVDGTMNADDFRNPAVDEGGGTILDPLQDGQASDDSSHESTITDPALRDLATKSSAQSDSARNADSGDDRYRHMQSRADKAQRLADEHAQKIADLEAQLRLQQPIVNMLTTDEQLQQLVQARLAGQQTNGLKPPEAPVQPESYNEAEAYTNPQSESYRFRKANEKYLRDRQDYLEGLYRQQQEFQVEQQRQLRQRQAEQQQVQKLHEELVRDYQLTPAEARQFFQDMTSESSTATENLVRYWRFLQSNPIRRQGGPPPPTGGGGAGRGQAPDPSELFNRQLRELAKGRR